MMRKFRELNKLQNNIGCVKLKVRPHLTKKTNKVAIHTAQRGAGLESGGVKSCVKIEEFPKYLPE